jgi:RND family efflux transporter MFP subunit
MITPSRKSVLLTSAVLLVGVATLLSDSCSRTAKVEADASKAPDAPTVAVAKATIEDLSHALVLTAEFKPYQEVELMAKVAGYVKEISVDVGDRVKKDQVLAVLEIPEMADDRARAEAGVSRSQAEVTRAQDQVHQAESAHEIEHSRSQRLLEASKQSPGLIAQQDLDDARGKDLVTEAQVSAAKSNLAAAQEQVHYSTAELQKIKTLFDYTSITAPFAGVVTKRYADKGSMLQAGTSSSSQAMPLVRLSENSRLRLILPVPESAVPTVHLGQKVDVLVPTLKRSFPGTVARFSDKVSVATRTMDTELDVQNPTLVLIPGMYAQVDLSLDSRHNVLVVPVPAVEVGSDDSSGQVAVVTAEHHVEIRKVQLGLQTSTKVEIRSGLKEGDLVVVAGRSGLQSGEEVKPKLTDMSASSQ